MKLLASSMVILGTLVWTEFVCTEPYDDLKKILAIQQSQIAELQARQERAYVHGVSYNGGNSPKITLVAGGGTLGEGGVRQGDFIPYQLQDGTWRLKFNIVVTLSSIQRSGADIHISGVTFFNNGGDGQAIAGGSAYALAHFQTNAEVNGGKIITRHELGYTGEYWWSGDVKLASKPTWAY